MAVFKCEKCGGELEFINGSSVCECEYCGSKQTLPKLINEKSGIMFERAGHFRRNNDFDRAMEIYERILDEDNTDSKAYWSIVLCRYGIEYVEDPVSHQRIPTVNRTQQVSVFADGDYKEAIKYADDEQRSIYESEAKAIDEIQKNILDISKNEKPFDIFICYKETDEEGVRTRDSVLANDMYFQLIEEGYKVFFSRITLEDKIGTAYEPYIFAALNSSKIMIVVGTKPEYFKAVWVKNEWSRFLALMNNGAKKVLIPAYKDMDPYDLPDEFGYLQAMDMGKLGFMQDLIRGIKKILGHDEKEDNVVEKQPQGGLVGATSGGNDSNITALLKRGFMALEDDEWNNADNFFERVLDMDAECAEAYLGKMLACNKLRNIEEVKECLVNLDRDKYYKKMIKFGDELLIEQFEKCNRVNKANMEERRKSELYNEANRMLSTSKSIDDYNNVLEIYSSIKDYKDSADLYKEVEEKIKKEEIYVEGKKILADIKNRNSTIDGANNVNAYINAGNLFQSIRDYKDSERQLVKCRDNLEKEKMYFAAREHFESACEKDDYLSVSAEFDSLVGYRDANEWIVKCNEKINEISIRKWDMITLVIGGFFVVITILALMLGGFQCLI